MKPTFIISCPIDTYSGYGSRSRDLVKAIIEIDKYDVKIIPQRWGNTPWGFIKDNPEWGFLQKHLFQPNPQDQHPQPDIWMQITVPNEYQPVGKFNIGVTAGIETTLAPAEFIEGCNKMNLILGSSNHTINVLKNSKFQKQNPQTKQPEGNLELTTNTEVIFEGVNTEIYKPVKSTLDLSGVKEEFSYLFVGTWLPGDIGQDRKNVGLLIKSFCETFKNKPKSPALILKVSHGVHSYIDRDLTLSKIQQIKNTVKGKLPNIYLLHGEFSDIEVNELYNHPKVKAMISLTKGEGFGRPLLEFTQSKKPIVTTGWSGHIDFLQPDMSVLLNGTLENVHPSAANKFLLQESKWFSVDSMHLGRILKDMYKKYNSFKENAKRQGYFCKKEFSYEKMKEKLEGVLSTSIPTLPKQVNLKLPKLKKMESPNLKLPNLKSKSFPNLKKVNA
jgi:hypothetical protein